MIAIRRATLDDAEVLARLAEGIFRDTFATADNRSDLDLYCAKSFGIEIQQQEILDANSVTLLAEMEDQPIGFAHILLQAPNVSVSANQPSELRRLYVEKEWHGRGVAKELMAHILSVVAHSGSDHIWLGVWEHNPRAIAFYQKHGFEVAGEHVFQFGNDPQRDLIMISKVNESFASSDSQII